MNNEFSLETFLKNYEPKKIDPTPYLRCPKLRKYIALDKITVQNLIPSKTYIKLVKTEDMFCDRNLPDHIRPGGILLAGGIFGEKFCKEDNPSKWTHLMLKYDPEPRKLDDGTQEKVDVEMSSSKFLMKKMSRLIILMNKLATIAINSKKEMLNHPKIIEYLFHKSISKFTDINKATELMQNDYVKNVKLGPVTILEIDSYFMLIQDMREKYILAYQQYLKFMAEYKSLTKSKLELETNLPYTPNISPIFLKISDILDGYKTNHIMKWSFFVKAEENNIAKIKPYNFDLNFEVDFYGSITNKENRMVQFVIMYDTHKIDYHDYLKQLYLATMNIHVLRLNSKLDPKTEIKSEIKTFLKKILRTDEYTILNPLPLTSFGKKETTEITEKLTNFYENFKSNHIIYLKYYAGKKNDNESDNESDDESSDINIRHIYSNKPADESCKVSDDFLRSIIKDSS